MKKVGQVFFLLCKSTIFFLNIQINFIISWFLHKKNVFLSFLNGISRFFCNFAEKKI